MGDKMELNGDLHEDLPSTPLKIYEFSCPQGEVEKLSKIVKHVFQTEQLTDITLYAKGQPVRAHRLVLLAYCTNLEHQILSDGKGDDGALLLELDCEPIELRIVLGYIYQQEVIVCQNQLVGVANAAKMLGVTELRDSCLTAMEQLEVTQNNCLQIWADAKEVGQEELEEKARRCALTNFSSLKNSEVFRKLPANMMKEYICHEDLVVTNPEERLNAVKEWSKTDSSREQSLSDILDALPEDKMSHWQDDPELEYSIGEISDRPSTPVECITGAQRLKADVQKNHCLSSSLPTITTTEKCLVFTRGSKAGKKSDEVMMIRLEHNYDVLTLGRLGATYPNTTCPRHSGILSCCMVGNHVFISGLGHKGDSVWRYSMVDGTSYHYRGMLDRRQCQAMCADRAGQLYIFGGKTSALFPKALYSVEKIDTSNCSLSKLEDLPFATTSNLFCLDLQKQNKVLLCGAEGTDGNGVLQVYDLKEGTSVHNLQMPFSKGGNAYGAVLVKGHLVVILRNQTLVLTLEDVLSGRSHVTLSASFVVPNTACAVLKSLDGNKVLLLGGKPKDGKPQCYVYEANVDDVINGEPIGWRPAHIPWTLGEYRFTGGYDVIDYNQETSKLLCKKSKKLIKSSLQEMSSQKGAKGKFFYLK